ncbi:MAG TPA: molybdenum cofactor biosynthesis protein B [Myxococcales bacterium]|nr:molybdenum cofactor biosynthesis protein B [Myxococcales bacterium]
MSHAPHEEHRRRAPPSVACFVVTSSRSRTEANDEGGRILREGLEGAGHRVVGRRLVPDDEMELRRLAAVDAPRAGAQALLYTGGTGLSPHDRTLEALEPLWTRRLPGFGELFRQLSFAEVGPAAMMSRAEAGAIGPLFVVALPGSPAAVRLALEKLILPELGHAVGLLQGA